MTSRAWSDSGSDRPTKPLAQNGVERERKHRTHKNTKSSNARRRTSGRLEERNRQTKTSRSPSDGATDAVVLKTAVPTDFDAVDQNARFREDLLKSVRPSRKGQHRTAPEMRQMDSKSAPEDLKKGKAAGWRSREERRQRKTNASHWRRGRGHGIARRALVVPSTGGSVRFDRGNGHNTEAPDGLRRNRRPVSVGERGWVSGHSLAQSS